LPMSSFSKSSSPSLSSPLSLSTTTRAFLFITFDCCVGIIDERREAEASLTGARETGVLVVVAQRRRRQWLRSDCGGSAAMAAQRWGAAMAEKVAAQRWR
jgi:hypothetical protein